MKKSIRIAAMALTWLMIMMAISTAMVGCDTGHHDDETNGTTTAQTTEKTEETTTAPTTPDNTKTEYTISVKTIGGRAISGLTFHIYEGLSEIFPMPFSSV